MKTLSKVELIRQSAYYAALASLPMPPEVQTSEPLHRSWLIGWKEGRKFLLTSGIVKAEIVDLGTERRVYTTQLDGSRRFTYLEQCAQCGKDFETLVDPLTRAVDPVCSMQCQEGLRASSKEGRQPMTLREFVDTKRALTPADLERIPYGQNAPDKPEKGYVYLGELVIECTDEWEPNTERPRGRWYVLIERDEIFDDDLSVLELAVYEYAKTEELV